MKYLLMVIVLAPFVWTCESWAHVPDAGKVTGAFGLLLDVPSEGLILQLSRRPRAGLNLQVLGDIDSLSSLQIELGVIPHQYTIQDGTLPVREQVNTTQMDLGYRRWFAEHLSGSLLLSSIYTVGDVDREVEQNGMSNPQTNLTTSAHETRCYGLKMGLQLELGNREFENPTLDVRYFIPFSPKAGEDLRSLDIFLGYRFEMR